MMHMLSRRVLMQVYHRLFKFFGPQSWWPAQTPFEVIVGAILVQNTNWGNVEKAMHNLHQRRILTPKALYHLPLKELAVLIRPAGYYNIKAQRLRNFLEMFFERYNGDLARMRIEPLKVLRQILLQVNGIGEETADSILLYCFEKPIFVVDAYTKRILSRHGHLTTAYGQIQQYFASLPEDVNLYNEYHALFVRVAKEYCRPQKQCAHCPLNNMASFPIVEK